jgi:hypothetical protein
MASYMTKPSPELIAANERLKQLQAATRLARRFSPLAVILLCQPSYPYLVAMVGMCSVSVTPPSLAELPPGRELRP